jgi:hypothetical protein
MELLVGLVIGVLLHKHKEKVSEICLKVLDKVKSLFSKS